MKKARLTEEQIVGILQEHEAGAIPDTSISGCWEAREMTALIERCGMPGIIVSDKPT